LFNFFLDNFESDLTRSLNNFNEQDTNTDQHNLLFDINSQVS